LRKAAPPQARIIAEKEAVSQYKTGKLHFFDWIKGQLGQDTTSARTQ
jgi:hypothetical protein